MFKRISALFILLLAPFLLTACSSATTTGSKTEDTNSKNEMPRRPDFGQPEAKPDVNGVVKSITGNEVVVLKVEMGQGFRNASSTPDGAPDKATTLSLGTTSGGPGAGGGPGMGQRRQGGEASAEDRAQMLAKIKEMSTGEEKIIIPVGIKMLKRSNEAGSREMVEATLSDITSDKTLMIWLNKDVTDK
ncbi:MAG: hypothetical protein WAW11_01245, partial [Patescibacteria group bacterium]